MLLSRGRRDVQLLSKRLRARGMEKCFYRAAQQSGLTHLGTC